MLESGYNWTTAIHSLKHHCIYTNSQQLILTSLYTLVQFNIIPSAQLEAKCLRISYTNGFALVKMVIMKHKFIFCYIVLFLLRYMQRYLLTSLPFWRWIEGFYMKFLLADKDSKLTPGIAKFVFTICKARIWLNNKIM